jgi:hypothetical protein
VIERIDETTVAELSGVRVAMGNMTEGTYTLSDGSTTSGAMCRLATQDDATFDVGKGSLIVIGGRNYLIVRVHKPPAGQLGYVELQALSAGPVSASGLDFTFDESCPNCSAHSGWDGTTEVQMGRLFVGMACPSCGNRFSFTDGILRRRFNDDPPTFTPGRR